MTTALVAVEERLAALPPEEQIPRRELLERVADLVVSRPLEEVVALVDRLAEGGVNGDVTETNDEPWSLNAARARNLERILADQAQLARECIPARTLREGMRVSRQRLHQLVGDRRLVAIQFRDGSASLFPFWQFVPGLPVRTIPGLPQLIEAAREADMGTLTLHFFMVEPNDRLEGCAPHELFARGGLDRVIEVILSSGLGRF